MSPIPAYKAPFVLYFEKKVCLKWPFHLEVRSIAKVSQNRTKYILQQTNKQNKRPFFLPKINKVFLSPILQNLMGKSVLNKQSFENDPLDEPKKMQQSKKL